MRIVNLVDVMALAGLIIMLAGVWMWLGAWASVAVLGAVMFVLSVRVASKTE